MNFIWSTRGRSWGFRFLRDGGLTDPLHVYEAAFGSFVGAQDVCAPSVQGLAVRFPDPEGRRDRAERMIPHSFVVLDGLASLPASVDEARGLLWPLVSDDYARLYE